MPIVVPEAEWRPFTGKSTIPVQQDILCAHTEVGTNEGSITHGAKDGNPYAHCYTSCRGNTVQCKDLALRAAANLEGNPYVLAWETEDINSACFPSWDRTCGNVPAWTDAQVERLIKDFAWACARFDIPPELIPDTKAGRRGLAYHRQGVPGSPEWVTGNLAWSTSVGKCCPDWRRIAQFKTEVIPGIQALLAPAPPVPEDTTDMLLIKPANTAIATRYLFTGDALHYLPTSNDIKNLVAADVKVWEVSDALFSTLRSSYPIHGD